MNSEPASAAAIGGAGASFPGGRLLVVYPGSVRYMLRPKVEVMSLAQCVAELA